MWHGVFIFVWWHLRVCVIWLFLCKGLFWESTGLFWVWIGLFQEYLQNTDWIVSTWLYSYLGNNTCVCVWYDYSGVGFDSIIFVTWLIHMSDTSHLYVWYDSISCVTWLIVAFERLYVYRLTFSHVCLFTCLCLQMSGQTDRQPDR